MEVYRRSSWLLLLLGLSLLATTLQGVQGEVESEGPSESECRPYIEKALKELETGDSTDLNVSDDDDEGSSKEDIPTVEITTDDSSHVDGDGDDDVEGIASTESAENDETPLVDEHADDAEGSEDEVADKSDEEHEPEDAEKKESDEADDQTQSKEADDEHKESTEQEESGDQAASQQQDSDEEHKDSAEDDKTQSVEEKADSGEDSKSEETKESDEKQTEGESHENDDESQEKGEESHEVAATESQETEGESSEKQADDESKEKETEDVSKEKETEDESKENEVEDKSKEKESEEESKEKDDGSLEKDDEGHSQEKESDEVAAGTDSDERTADGESEEKGSVEDEIKRVSIEETEAAVSQEQADQAQSAEDAKDSKEDDSKVNDSKEDEKSSADGGDKNSTEDDNKSSTESGDKSSKEDTKSVEEKSESDVKDGKEDADDDKSSKEVAESDSKESEETATDSEEHESAPEEDLSEHIEIPEDLRPRDHVNQLLKLDEESAAVEAIAEKTSAITLKELKKLYENAIQPLEVLYKYRDLSNRHFGDSEIFSKPLVLFMGPWSGGKSSIINYLVDNEYNDTTLRTGAEPSPAYFNILMHGNEPEILEGTQLAADFTFSGLQKFGQGLEERLRGLKLPSKLLEKINLVEIPGILEVRKQVSRVFPFNDACQWFIDRADIIFLVYDPSKLDVGPETEAILDQLKGREYQTRIVLNKADQVKPEELMRVQSALIWNISPLMSSAQPPVMYTTSLWSRPYEPGAPTRLLQAQERAFLRDLRSAVDKRIENKISSARRFAVRVRNHAKMVDCYLTTYYNHKSVFGNRKQISDQIIENPQNYHIYEGLSTLTNISRYDLPDPDVYRDFFKLNPLYDFQQLSSTCTYFRGCPINRLDVAIAYDLPELVGKHRRLVEAALAEANLSQTPGS